MISSLSCDTTQLSILLLHPRDADGQRILRHLQRLGCEVTMAWPPAGNLPRSVDVVFALFDPCFAAPPWLASAPPTAVVAIIGEPNSAAIRMLEASNAHSVMVKPVEAVELLTNLILARNNFRYERRLLTKVAKLEETIRSFRNVERAKAILMEQRNLREKEAYEYLRTQAMNKRVSVGTIASAIIATNELLS